MSIFTCENCKKEFENGYGQKNRFCTRSCCASFNSKKGDVEKRRKFMEKARAAQKEATWIEKESKEGNCRFCNRFCKNQNSLRNHERRCEKNPNRQTESGGKRKGIVYKQKYSNQFLKAKELGLPIPAGTRKGKPGTFLGKHHTEEQKRKISESMKRAHAEGRAGHWTRRVAKASRPEQFLIEVLKNELQMEENKDYKREIYYKGYFLDFCWKKKKLVIEMDGEQHQTLQEQIDRDKRKDALLKADGYKELRIPWKDCFHEPKVWIEKVKDFLK